MRTLLRVFAWTYRVGGWLIGSAFIFRSVWGERNMEQFYTGVGAIVMWTWLYRVAMSFSAVFETGNPVSTTEIGSLRSEAQK